MIADDRFLKGNNALAERNVKAKRANPEKNTRSQGSAIASILKTLRTRAGLTTSKLAERSDVSMSTISKIESGQLSPGYETILRLSLGLEVDVAELFNPSPRGLSSGRRGVTRRGQGMILESPRYIYEALAADVSNKEFLPLFTIIKPGGQFDPLDMPAHEGEEFIYVCSGEVTLHSEHYEPLVLEPGDSVYFDSRGGHVLVGSETEETRILWICSHRDALRVAHDSAGPSS